MTNDFFLTEWFFLGMRWISQNIFGGVPTAQIFLTILMSTLILRLLMLYTDIKQRKSTMKMQEVQPQLNKLQERYKNDPRKLQIEQSKLMKESGVSMFSGCLPMLLTIPLLFCFIAAFRFWGYEQNVKMLLEMDNNIKVAEANGTKAEVSETFKNSQFLWVHNIWQPDNGMKPVIMKASDFFNQGNMNNLIYFKDNKVAKARYNELFDMATDTEYYSYDNYYAIFLKNKTDENGEATPYEARDLNQKEKESLRNYRYKTLTDPLVHSEQCEGENNGMYLLPILSTAFQFFYAWFMQRKQQKAQQGQPQQPGMGKFMLFMMPAISFIFCLSATAAFAVYWTLSSLIMLVMNLLITKIISSSSDKKKAEEAK